MFLVLLLGAAALLLMSKGKTASSLAKIPAQLLGLSATPSWPKQRTAALDSGKHYFFALPIFDDMKAPRRLASFEIALRLMGWDSVKSFPAGADISTADSPHPADWADYKGLRVAATWKGSPGQIFNIDLVKPFGASDVTVWMSTDDFVNMHASKAA
jgi:hypothetical protein